MQEITFFEKKSCVQPSAETLKAAQNQRIHFSKRKRIIFFSSKGRHAFNLKRVHFKKKIKKIFKFRGGWVCQINHCFLCRYHLYCVTDLLVAFGADIINVACNPFYIQHHLLFQDSKYYETTQIIHNLALILVKGEFVMFQP